MGLGDPSLPCANSACHHEQWYINLDMIGFIGLSFPPASSDYGSVSQLLGFIKHIYKFLWRIIRNPHRLLKRTNSETRPKDARCLLRGINKQLMLKIARKNNCHICSPLILESFHEFLKTFWHINMYKIVSFYSTLDNMFKSLTKFSIQNYLKTLNNLKLNLCFRIYIIISLCS